MGVPLPPYIKREPVDSDKVYYQTVYAKNEGALASPTAGLHFSQKLLEDLGAQGINLAYVTCMLPGNISAVRCENILEHKMEPEHFLVPDEAVAKN